MTQEKETNAAADVFETVFRDILDAHACIKVFQQWKYFLPNSVWKYKRKPCMSKNSSRGGSKEEWQI